MGSYGSFYLPFNEILKEVTNAITGGVQKQIYGKHALFSIT